MWQILRGLMASYVNYFSYFGFKSDRLLAKYEQYHHHLQKTKEKQVVKMDIQ
jgi:hypothetical protein